MRMGPNPTLLRPIVLLALLAVATPSLAAETLDINTFLMRSTFKLAGQGSTGTAFILAKPTASDPSKGYFVLVTAGHVLNAMQGDNAVLFLRKKDGDSFQKVLHPFKVRENGRPLWTSHPEADVAVMYLPLPTDADITPVPTEMLATDQLLKQLEVHPGDRLSCLGYPYNLEANDAGFPILRSGYIASYPLIPTKQVKTFMFDFNVFEGNSGGPVYLVDSNRTYGGSTKIGTVQFLIGLVSEQISLREETKALIETRTQTHRLGLAIVIHSSLIREALDLLLPAPSGAS